jgi:pyruvate,water dikinase
MNQKNGNEDSYVIPLHELDNGDTPLVGGKNASLGEMIGSLQAKGVRVPGGFATTAEAYRTFIRENALEAEIRECLDQRDSRGIEETGKAIRRMIRKASWPKPVARAIRQAYQGLKDEARSSPTVAVRSSATAEDLPEASFAGQQETFLNISGANNVLHACRECFASLFTDRAISYREEQGFDHLEVALSAGVQFMVRADKGASGVLFTLDTDSGFRDVVRINAAWGLGETVVGGEVNPDDYLVYKPLLENPDLRPVIGREMGSKRIKAVYSRRKDRQIENVKTRKSEQDRFVLEDKEVLQLARWGCVIENHYKQPMDIEWARDGKSGKLFILQARPETVASQKDPSTLVHYSLQGNGTELVRGTGIGDKAGHGKVRKLKRPDEGDKFEDGDILVTSMTNPDWGPIMKRASAVVTDKGGRTAHAAIVSRELGIPAVVGCGNALEKLEEGMEVTIDCTTGETGRILEGIIPIHREEMDLGDAPETRTGIMTNLASPDAAFRWHALPVDGIGLARLEFIINNIIQAHPLALADPDRIKDRKVAKALKQRIRGWPDGKAFYIRTLAEGVARIAASRYPDPVLVRLSDFKSNEYAQLIGGKPFEPSESNPMIGFRGAARYRSERFKEAFAMECEALRRAREDIGLDNIIIMIPFCRTVEEVDGVLMEMAEHGLVRGEKGLQIYLMAEIPSNIFMAEEFATRCDGFSIGSNDLTQLILGISRDSEALSPWFNEMDPAVQRAIHELIERGHASGIKVGLCGQGPSDRPEFAEFLVRNGIDSFSVSPDKAFQMRRKVAGLEKDLSAKSGSG